MHMYIIMCFNKTLGTIVLLLLLSMQTDTAYINRNLLLRRNSNAYKFVNASGKTLHANIFYLVSLK